jgi:hypothetical protein
LTADVSAVSATVGLFSLVGTVISVAKERNGSAAPSRPKECSARVDAKEMLNDVFEEPSVVVSTRVS